MEPIDLDTVRIISIDQSLTGTGIVIYSAGEVEIKLIETSKLKEASACQVCGKILMNPKSKGHVNSQFHQEALARLGDIELKEEKNKMSFIERSLRIREITRQIKVICQEYQIQYGIIEGLSYGSQGAATFDLGALFHMILDVFITYKIKFIIIPPTTAKRYWTGKGNASKEELIEESKRREIEIPFNYNDNCNDAFIFIVFIINLLKGALDEEWYDKITKSW